MNFVDYIALGTTALGFLNGMRHGLAMELYRFITAGIVVVAGCSAHTFLGRALSFIPGLDPENYGIVGYVVVIVVSFFLVRFLLGKLKTVLQEKYGDEKSGLKGGLVGMLRSGTIAVGALVGLVLSDFSWASDGSAIGRFLSGLLGS